ncbi:MAG: GNAT family N-acetyltransferase [Sphingomonas sp.]|uniref:GNAT family N-acetyltransferase n=1 Tax=Sphingomonas sp. TaxID=28214 RepID=UPI0035A8A586|nr:GNAT family N-acetyltransferase [Sphingomonas sp.]
MTSLHLRLAQHGDAPAIAALMERAIADLQRDFLDPGQIAASRSVMGLDTQLIDDGSYVLVLDGETLAGCGGWSNRATPYGGNHSKALRDPRRLDPGKDPARIRAMFTSPDYVRRGIGRLVLDWCESAARDAGFDRAELIATLAGQPLYAACGYQPIERVEAPPVNGAAVPLIRMGKPL